MIVIPGSKNTIDDLKDIKDRGTATEIIKASRKLNCSYRNLWWFPNSWGKRKDPYGIEVTSKRFQDLEF